MKVTNASREKASYPAFKWLCAPANAAGAARRTLAPVSGRYVYGPGCWSILNRLRPAATPLRPMLSSTGVASIAELIAAVCLVVALAGFAKWRAASWLVCGAAAAVALVVAALVVIGQS